jgi:hypothetical protein
LLLIDVANLKPDVYLSQRAGRVVENVPEAFQTGLILALLLVNDTKSKVYLVCLFVV